MPIYDFIIHAISKHGNTYSYENAIYKNSQSKISITCKIHGDFQQRAGAHIQGSGCPKCHFENLSSIFSKNYQTFISQASSIHLNKYTYQDTVYINDREKIEITCNKHGNFWQIPSNHLRGHGCQKCKFSHGERKVAVCLENMNVIYDIQVKIPGCKNKRCLPFDFGVYSETESLIGLIEYQGKQHYVTEDYFGQDISFQKPLLLNDQIKRDYCKLHNIPLLEIPYTNIDEVESLIQNFIFYQS